MPQNRDGKTPETAFIIADSSGEMTVSIARVIERLFGGKDGDYFVHSETTQTNKNKKYKVFYVGDSQGKTYNVFFEIKS